MYEKAIKIFQEDKLYHFYESLVNSSNFYHHEINELEKSYLSRPINKSDIAMILDIMNARYLIAQRIIPSKVNQIEYLIKLLYSRYNVNNESLSENDLLFKFLHFFQLKEFLNNEISLAERHEQLANLYHDVDFFEYINNDANLLSPIYLSKAILGDIEEATIFFADIQHSNFYSALSFVYRCLFYIVINNDQLAKQDLDFLHEKDLSSLPNGNSLITLKTIGIMHNILTPNWVTRIDNKLREE